MTPAPGAARPVTVTDALLQLAAWLDEADRLIDTLAAARGLERRNAGDEVQQDLRELAGWFTAHPVAAADAWARVTSPPVRGRTPDVVIVDDPIDLPPSPPPRDRREPGDPPWTAAELLDGRPDEVVLDDQCPITSGRCDRPCRDRCLRSTAEDAPHPTSPD